MQNSFSWIEQADEDLVRMAQAGGRDAFSELTRRNYCLSLKLATSILRDRTEAEDEVQNAYWKAFRHLDQFNNDARFSTWMTRIVVNQCLMRLRRANRARLVFIDDLERSNNRTFELADSGGSPESLFRSRELTALVGNEIRRIPPLLRNALLLRDVDEMSMHDVAERLGVSVSAAKSRLLRARAELRIRLSKHRGSAGHLKSANLKAFGAIV